MRKRFGWRSMSSSSSLPRVRRLPLERLPVLDRLVLVAVLCLGVAHTAGAQSSGLVAAYGFEETSGSGVVDSSGLGNAGTVNGATRVAGRFGKGLEFNGSGALLTVPDSASLDLTSGLTLEAWLFPTSAAQGWRDVIYKGPDDIYYLEGASPLGFPATGGTYSPTPLYASSPLPLNTWSHLAATYDGAVIRLYVNGSQVATRSQVGIIAASSGALTLGGNPLYGQYWQGLIDEVRVYNRALTATQIQSDMNTAVAAVPPDPTPPTVSLLSPTAGSTTTHVVPVTASAADNVAVFSVEFFADGSSIGVDLTAPYVVGWNTTTATNGTHTLAAVARDRAGNQTTSAPISVRVVNPGFVNEVVVPDITAATTIAFLPDGRMLVGELTGTIWVVQPGASAPDPVPFLQLDYSQLFGEQGLMDIRPDPNFAANHYYYVFYTRGFPGSNNRNRLSRFTASGNGTVAGSELVLWQDDVNAEAEHHAGAIAFGTDGKLYFTYGDQFIPENSQRLDTYRGKVLRINPDGTIPTDNPFFDGNGPNKDQIWAYGLRNPYRMSIDAPSGRMFIGDVGGNDASTAFEEIDLGARGANFGWPLCEGMCGIPGVTSPLHAYPHLGRDACVTAGFVYRGTQFPSEYVGSFFFGDYVQNTIKRLVFDANGNLAAVLNFWPPDGSTDGSVVGDPVKLIEGPDGALYYVDLGFNDQHLPNPAAIRRIRYVISNLPPVASASASPTSGAAPLQVTFSSAGSADPEGAPLSFLWTFGDGGTSTQPNPVHTYGIAGPYVARLRVSDGVSSALSPDISITVGNPPVPAIQSPADGSTFRAGEAIAFSGSATDPDQGTLGPSALSWTIVFHHEGHIHPGAGPLTGAGGTFTIPTTGHDFQGDTAYEFILTATDATGLSRSTSVTIYPEKVNLTFTTVPSGLAVDINGIRKQTPFVLDELIGFQDTIGAPDQTSGNTSYGFVSWSDNGAQTHSLIAPATDQSYVATFEVTGEPGLVAAYGFNEGAGTTAGDSSSNGNLGSVGAATWTTSGKYGGALQFNGSSARVTVNDAPSLDLSSTLTLAAWVRPTTVNASWRDVIFKADDIYFLEATSLLSGVPAMGGTFSGGPLYGTASLPINTWTHLAATYDGAAVRLYVNGVEVASRAATGPIATSALPLSIGGDAIYGQYFAGMIDEVRVYNRALGASEVVTAMNTPVGGTPPPPPSDTEPPTAPTNLAATAVSASQIDLGWTASTDNVGVQRYQIERQGGANASFVEVGTVTGTSFTDLGLTALTRYSYRVRASDAAGNLSGYSAVASARTRKR